MRRYISQSEYEKQMKRIKAENNVKQRKAKLREEKSKYRPKFKLPSTSKLVLAGMIALCVQIIFFCEHVMILFGDFTAMYALIGVVAALAPVIWAYFSKSTKENSVGGITYELAMLEKSKESPMPSDDSDAVG